MQERIKRLRQQIAEAREQLSSTEDELAARKKEIEEMDARVEAHLGHLFRELASLDDEIDSLERRLQLIQGRAVYGNNYDPIEVQYEHTWTSSNQTPNNTPDRSQTLGQKSIKQLYRKLARRYHPDLAASSIDRDFRNEKMAALNSAYSSGSLAELLALEMDQSNSAHEAGQTEERMARALEIELATIRGNIERSALELERVHQHPIVQLGLEIKLARRDGRNLLAEMALDLRHKIDERQSQRDNLRWKLDQFPR